MGAAKSLIQLNLSFLRIDQQDRRSQSRLPDIVKVTDGILASWIQDRPKGLWPLGFAWIICGRRNVKQADGPFSRPQRLILKPELQALGCVEKIVCPGGDMDLAALMGMGSPFFRTVERERRDAVAVLYTGGTTGNPKGVMLTQEGMDFSIQSTVRM
jgi:acyl-CoA synthetase (AMP-forming)/AMP-acid ligase II